MIEKLSSDSVQRFIRQHEQDDEKDFMLKQQAFAGVPPAILVSQIAGKKKAKDKLPTFYKTSGIVYPPPVNLEQCSSEQTALYKVFLLRSLFLGESEIIGTDLTGGFGVDGYHFSKAFHTVHFVEPDETLLDIARHNHRMLGSKNLQYHPLTAEQFVKGLHVQSHFFYADPSRRGSSGRKVHALEDCEPDVTSLSNAIFAQCRYFLIKTSPLLDIHAALQRLINVEKIVVLSIQNECKEVLYLCEGGFRGEASVVAVNFSLQNAEEFFQFKYSEEGSTDVGFSDPQTYLYEPNASILKAGAFRSIARAFNVQKLAPNTHLYTSDTFIKNFPGRIFQVQSIIKPDSAAIKKHFSDGKANVTTRNYPLSVQALKKKTGLKDGGIKFLIGCSGQRKKFLIVALRLQKRESPGIEGS